MLLLPLSVKFMQEIGVLNMSEPLKGEMHDSFS
jgi:hypothetical protein